MNYKGFKRITDGVFLSIWGIIQFLLSYTNIDRYVWYHNMDLARVLTHNFNWFSVILFWASFPIVLVGFLCIYAGIGQLSRAAKKAQEK